MNTEEPATQQEILAAFEQQQAVSLEYWTAFDTDAFFRRIGDAWSPAETVRHLSKSTRPVAKALGTSRLVLRWMFGKPCRSSMTYEALRERYREALAAGGKAGKFAPSAHTESDLEAWRATILRDFVQTNADLQKSIARWPDAKLDRLQLPHPLLGKLTIREMLFFTLYHHRHHIAVIERHLRSS